MHSEAGIKAEPSAVDCNSTYIERWSEEFSLFAEHAGSMQSVLGFGAPSNGANLYNTMISRKIPLSSSFSGMYMCMYIYTHIC